RDVRIVNLSLLNTIWYIKQLKELEPKVPISYTEREIDEKLNHQLNPIEKAMTYRMPEAGIVVKIPGRDTKRALRIQDQMVVNIVDSNKWKKPIYFAVTVSSDNLMGLEPYLQMQGLVFRVLPRPISGNNKLDIKRTSFLLEKVYRFRSLGDGSFPISETAEKLMSNYAASFIQMGVTMRQPLAKLKAEIEHLEKPLPDSVINKDSSIINSRRVDLEIKRKEYNGKLDMLINKLDQCVGLMPWDWRPRMIRQELLMTHDRLDLAFERIQEALLIEPENMDYLKMKAQLHEMRGEKAESNQILKKLAAQEKDPWTAYSMMSKNYADLGLIDSAIYIMKQFQKIYPGDRRAADMIKRFEMLNNVKKADSSVKNKTDSVNKG
ncbi:MAG: hypothetical protein PVI26_08760, partial [Chitinispirillia bacterium]